MKIYIIHDLNNIKFGFLIGKTKLLICYYDLAWFSWDPTNSKS